FQAEDGIRDFHVTGVQTCALPILGLGAVCTVWVLYLFGSSARSALTVARVHEVGSESGGYLVSYVLPFLTVETPGALDALAYGRSEERRVGKECRSRCTADASAQR